MKAEGTHGGAKTIEQLVATFPLRLFAGVFQQRQSHRQLLAQVVVELAVQLRAPKFKVFDGLIHFPAQQFAARLNIVIAPIFTLLGILLVFFGDPNIAENCQRNRRQRDQAEQVDLY